MAIRCPPQMPRIGPQMAHNRRYGARVPIAIPPYPKPNKINHIRIFVNKLFKTFVTHSRIIQHPFGHMPVTQARDPLGPPVIGAPMGGYLDGWVRPHIYVREKKNILDYISGSHPFTPGGRRDGDGYPWVGEMAIVMMKSNATGG